MTEIPMPVLTPRLMLRPVKRTDGEAVFEYKKESWQEFLPWMIWVHPPSIETRTIEDDVSFCEHFQGRFERREDITCLAFSLENNKLVGHGSLRHCNWDIPMFTLGFATRTGETGKGYGTEIGAALAKYAFEALSARKISTFHAEGNTGSRRVIEKIGFEKEGVLRQQHLLPDGRIVDEHHYGMLNKSSLPGIEIRWGRPL